MRTMLFVVVHRKQRCRTFFFIVSNAQSSTVLNLASFDVEVQSFARQLCYFVKSKQTIVETPRDPHQTTQNGKIQKSTNQGPATNHHDDDQRSS
jgi:hypothetical protein